MNGFVQMEKGKTMNNDLISKSHFDKRVREAVGMTIAELTADFKDGVRTTLELLKTEPTVDAVQVLRCEECKWWFKDENYDGLYRCANDGLLRKEDHYCACGERKNDE